MAKVKRPAALQSEIRLKRWPPGRVSQLKLFLGHLQQAIGVSLASQVEQSPKRKFSEFVPKIVPQDVVAEVEYREARIHFKAPRGLKNFLFYEFDISATAGFFNIDRFTTPETSYVFADLTNGKTFYIRLRVVTKNGEVGPWSDTIVITTPIAQAFGMYDGREVETRIANRGNEWDTVYQRTYGAIGGKTYYAIDYEISVYRDWTPDGNCEWSDGIFRWMDAPSFYPAESDFVQKGTEFMVSTYASNQQFSPSPFYVFSVLTDGFTTPLVIPGTWQNKRRGTFVQKFTTISAGQHTFRLEAKLAGTGPTHGGYPNDFIPTADSTQFVYGADMQVKLKNFNIFEVLVD